MHSLRFPGKRAPNNSPGQTLDGHQGFYSQTTPRSFPEHLTQQKLSTGVGCPKRVTTSIPILLKIPQFFTGSEIVHQRPKSRLANFQNI
jgi:hypothetical protein